MTIKYQSGNRITGLSSDTKPTNISTNSQFIETDTRNTFYYDGTSWQQPRFENMYEVFGSPKAKNRQHFVEWFSGKQLPSYWGTGGDGNETIEMYDGIDGGVMLKPANNGIYKPAYISTGFSGTRTSSSDATVRLYNPNGAVIIWVERWVSGASGSDLANAWDGGFSERLSGDAASENAAFWSGRGNQTLYVARGINSSGSQTDINSDFTQTNSSVCFKIELLPNIFKGTINGVLRTTQVGGNLPSAKLALGWGIQGRNSSSYTANQRLIRYCEAYNT